MSSRIRSVAVVVLTWNGREDTLGCIASLSNSDYSPLGVIVVDNGSVDDTLDAVATALPSAELIANGRNLGFAAGNNVGIKRALADGADAVFVLNNDTIVPPGVITTLVDALNEHPDAGVACPIVSYGDGDDRIWFAGSPFDPSRARAGRNSEYETGRRVLPDRPITIDRAVGAAMLVRREALEQVGDFAEELFFLYEDVDLSLRIRAAGWRIMLVPHAIVSHLVSASQGGEPVTPLTSYYGTRNDLEVSRRHAGLRGVRALRRELGCVGVHLASTARRAPRGTRLACFGSTLAGWRDFRRRRLGKRPDGN